MDKEDQYSPQFEEQLRISIHLAERAATKKQLAIIEKKIRKNIMLIKNE